MNSTNDDLTGDIFEPRYSIQFGSFEAFVEINDQKTKCYAIHNDNNQKQVTTWIASEVGKKISFSLTKTATQFHCEVTGFINGHNIGWFALEKWSTETVTFSGAVTSKSTAKKFMFVPITSGVTDYNGTHNSVTNRLATNFSGSDEIGQLKIQVRRASGLFYSDREDDNAEYSPDKESMIEHPKMTANIPHRVGLEKTDSHADFDKKYFKHIHELLATFVFVYRPIELLRKMNITVSPATSQVNTPSLPQTPKPIPRSYVQDMPSPNYLWTPTLAVTALQDRHSAVSSTEIMADNATENTVLPDPGISRTPSPFGTNTSNTIPTLSSLYDLLNATSRRKDGLFQPTENSELALPSPSDTPTIPERRLSSSITVPVRVEISELMDIDQEESQLLQDLEKLESRKRQLRKERKAQAAANRRVNVGTRSPETIDLTLD